MLDIYRLSNLFYDDKLETLINTIKKNNSIPNILITTLPVFETKKDKLKRFNIDSFLFEEINKEYYLGILQDFYNISSNNCKCFIFTDKLKIKNDIAYMEQCGFIFNDILFYKIKNGNNNNGIIENIKYILLFSKNKKIILNNLKIESLFIKEELKYKDNFNLKIIEKIMSFSLNKRDDCVVSFGFDKGELNYYCLKNNIECYLNVNFCDKYLIDKRINILKLNSNVKKEKKDYTEKNKKISKTLKKNSLIKKIKNIDNGGI